MADNQIHDEAVLIHSRNLHASYLVEGGLYLSGWVASEEYRPFLWLGASYHRKMYRYNRTRIGWWRHVNTLYSFPHWSRRYPCPLSNVHGRTSTKPYTAILRPIALWTCESALVELFLRISANVSIAAAVSFDSVLQQIGNMIPVFTSWKLSLRPAPVFD
jgi:hypothetical protein